MKKLMMIPIFVFGCAVGFAQNINKEDDDIGKEQSRWSFGPTVGFGHTYITPYAENFYPHWNAGMTLTYGPIEWWGFGTEVLYSIEGGRHYHSEGEQHTTRQHYLRVPLKAMAFFRDYEDDFRPKLSFGPSFGFLLGTDDSEDLDTENFDVGLNGTVGFNYRLNPGTWLNVDLGYYHGLSDVRKGNGVQDYNRHLGVNVGLAFGI
jgi:hypothetical protein